MDGDKTYVIYPGGSTWGGYIAESSAQRVAGIEEGAKPSGHLVYRAGCDLGFCDYRSKWDELADTRRRLVNHLRRKHQMVERKEE